MNTIGVMFANTNKKWPSAPEFLGKFELTEPFLKACVEAWRAGRSAGKVECKVEVRKESGRAVDIYRLSIIPPKAAALQK